MNLEEKKISGELIYKGIFLELQKDIVELPNGKQCVREFIHHPGAVVIIPILDNGDVVMERQFRYPSGQVFLELPAGKIDAGEDHRTCGERELLEETGYLAKNFEYIGKLHPGIGYTDEIIYIYKATGLKNVGSKLDEDEFLEVFTAPLNEIYEMMLAGKITDAKTMISLFWVKHHLI
ncbi:MAG: NUDIX hydrolase [Candidatus Marinimicrobia bacterium]|nr:NUDIX hydrolase [Candidatus Neomarinimicrobiota bacterium]